MSAGKEIKKEQAKIEGIESKALPFNENEYQDITDTLVNPSKIQLQKNQLYKCNRFIRYCSYILGLNFFHFTKIEIVYSTCFFLYDHSNLIFSLIIM